MSDENSGGVPPPRPAPDADRLPHALTFFLTAGQRRRVVRALKRHGADRATALVRALGAEQEPADEPEPDSVRIMVTEGEGSDE